LNCLGFGDFSRQFMPAFRSFSGSFVPVKHPLRWLAVGALAILVVLWANSKIKVVYSGGNFQARQVVLEIASDASSSVCHYPERAIRFKALPASGLPERLQIPGEVTVGRARFLVTNQTLTPADFAIGGARKLLVVCDTAYRDLPPRRFRFLEQAPPTHAAAYSDGSFRLLTETEFSALDRRNFVPLDDLYPVEKQP
jgi:hypothetical protein